MTWCRGRCGKINTYKTYGHAFQEEDKEEKIFREIQSKTTCGLLTEDKNLVLMQTRKGYSDFGSYPPFMGSRIT